jgi:glycine betaine/choline ABC-type transport system substrate-binding protein
MAMALVGAACGGDDDEAEDTGEGSATTAAGQAAQPATFKFRPLDAGGPITKSALRQGDVQVALLFSSDADIAENDWVALEDDKDLQQLENVTPAIRTDKRTDAIADALDAISAKLTTEELIEMNRKNSVDGQEPDVVAKEWLEDNDLLPYGGTKATGQLNVGSTNFAEQEIVAELYAQVLESAGVQVERKFQLGAREIVAPALEKGDIDLYPEYLGTYLLFIDDSTTVPSDKAAAAAELNELLESKGITMLAPSDAQDTNAFVVTKETAEKYDLSSVSDLAGVPDSLTLGGPPECPTRPFCLVGLKEIYGLKFEQ